MLRWLWHLAVAALPLTLGVGAGLVFLRTQDRCGRMVGALFAAKCHARLHEIQLGFQTAGTAFGSLVVLVALRGEHRRRRAVEQPDPEPPGGPS